MNDPSHTADYVRQGEGVPRTCCADHAFQDRLRIERAANRPEWDADPCANCGHGQHWHSTSHVHDCYGPMMEGCECGRYEPSHNGSLEAG